MRTRTGAEDDALTSLHIRVCEGHGLTHWCTKCSVTLTLSEQPPNAESGLRSTSHDDDDDHELLMMMVIHILKIPYHHHHHNNNNNNKIQQQFTAKLLIYLPKTVYELSYYTNLNDFPLEGFSFSDCSNLLLRSESQDTPEFLTANLQFTRIITLDIECCLNFITYFCFCSISF